MEGSETRERDEVFSKIVRAGKRTYFFDVKKTRQKNDFYLTITESKKRYLSDGEFKFEKHKIFLYKEDFEKFKEAMLDSFEFVEEAFAGNIEIDQDDNDNLIIEDEIEVGVGAELSDLEFEDLGK